MRTTKQIWIALMLLPLLCACQSDDIEEISEEPPTFEPLVIKATIGGGDKSRAQVQYGNQDVAAGEFFMWNVGDVITVCNMTDNSSSKFTIKNANDIDGKNATFTQVEEGGTLTMSDGDDLVALYGLSVDGVGKITTDADIRVQQVKTDNPGDEDLNHLQKTLKMYACAKADASGEIPDLHFKHLSSLMRVTVRNSQPTDQLNINMVEFTYGANYTFFNGVVGFEFSNGYTQPPVISGLEQQYWKSSTDANKMSITLNAGESYDLFFAVLSSQTEPEPTNNQLKITINNDDDNDGKLSTFIQGFQGITIEPGYRYWFDLTVTAEGKLMQTSKLPDYSWYTANKDAETFTLFSAKDLKEFANLVNGTATGVEEAPVSFEGKTVKIADGVRELNLNKESWTPIGRPKVGNTPSTPFNGTFDGNGCHITGLNVEVTEGYGGLFGYVASAKATVKNLRVNGTVTGSGKNIGGIAGYCGGVIQNCIFSGNISGKKHTGGIAGYCDGGSSIQSCIFSGDITGEGQAGGIAGYFNGSNSIQNCIFSGNVTGNHIVGGIVGENYGSITGCHSKGKVESSGSETGGISGYNVDGKIENCYSEANVTTKTYAGGIVGVNSGGTLKVCYATGEISANNCVGGIAGQNSSESTITNCIALNNSLIRTEGSDTQFGRIVGNNLNSSLDFKNCAAYSDMSIVDASGVTISQNKDGNNLSKEECYAYPNYMAYSFNMDDWGFDDSWQYLPWNKAFEKFSGITPDDYKIAYPSHLQ